MKKKYNKLGYSIGIDLIGMSSYILPGIGESFDIIWAPISAYLTYKLYGNTAVAVFNGVEEIVPFTDIIPTSTISWFLKEFKVIK